MTVVRREPELRRIAVEGLQMIRNAFVAVALAGCSGQLPAPRSEGERLYRARCTGCHRAYDPSEKSDWPRIVDKMQAEKKTHLSA